MRLSITDAKPGMVLREDIVMSTGTILLHKAQMLTREHIIMLTRRGITMIDIIETLNKTPAEPEPSPSKPEVPAPPKPSVSSQPAAPPKITVSVSSDLMSARLSIEPASGSSLDITCDDLMNALTRAEVKYGINEPALHSLVEKWHERKRLYEIDSVAKGIPAEPGREGALQMKVRYITAKSDLEILKDTRYFWQAPDLIGRMERVDPEMPIGEKQFGIPTIPGKNVKGDVVFTDEIVRTKITIGGGAALSTDGNTVAAKTSGIAYLIDEQIIGVTPVDFNGAVEITTTADRMKAHAVIHPAGEGGSMPTEKDIRSLIEKSGVRSGIKANVIGDLVSRFAHYDYPSEPVLVAEGTPPKNGDNGKPEFLFSIESSLKPKLNADGSVDYKNVDIVRSVPAGKQLVRLIPPSKGTPGTDIFGGMIKCQDGVAAKLPIGTNTAPDPVKPDILVASVDGIVRYNGIAVEVTEGYVISNNVDFSTGHVKYEKTVIVNGDVKSGFNIDCGGDLQVGGTIEDCTIAVGGNVLCKYGYVGSGKGIIDCKGDVNLGFAKNQVVRSRKNVNIAKEALNCTIYARQTITVHGNPVSAAGGTLVARDSITVYNVGNQSGIRTNLEIGIDFTLVEELKKTELQIVELNINYKKIVDTFSKYEKIAGSKKLSAKEEFLFTKLKTTMAKYSQQIAILEERKKVITSRMYDFNNSFVRVERSAMPGTIVKIGDRHFLVKEEVIGPKTIRLINHEIRVI